jgi:stress response protein YsnF
MANNTVIGIFEDEIQAQEVANDLKNEGFSDTDIHIGGKAHHEGFVAWLEHLFGGGPSYNGPYKEAVEKGKTVVAVDTDDRHLDQAAAIMEEHGAIDVDEEDSALGAQGSEVARGTKQETIANPRENARVNAGETRSIPVIKEDINVSKRNVIHGGVRVYSHATERPVEEQVRLREEKVRVERRPVNRPAGPEDANALRDQTIEMTETREEPVVNKTRRVVEEVVVGKEATERTETIRDKVRGTEVEVEQLGGNQGNVKQRTEKVQIPEFRRHYDQKFRSSGEEYPLYEDAYTYGYNMSNQPEYRGYRFDDIEDKLRTGFLQLHPNNRWESRREAVRYGWDYAMKNRRA